MAVEETTVLHIPWGGIRDKLHVYERLARRLILEGIYLHFIELQRAKQNTMYTSSLHYYISQEQKRTITMG